jgi:hypothetical protein
MNQIDICPCGIAADDCDYHKPETKEYFTGTPYKGTVRYTYVGNGEWKIETDKGLFTESWDLSSNSTDAGWSSVDRTDPKLLCMGDVAKRVEERHRKRRDELYLGWIKAALGNDSER